MLPTNVISCLHSCNSPSFARLASEDLPSTPPALQCPATGQTFHQIIDEGSYNTGYCMAPRPLDGNAGDVGVVNGFVKLLSKNCYPSHVTVAVLELLLQLIFELVLSSLALQPRTKLDTGSGETQEMPYATPRYCGRFRSRSLLHRIDRTYIFRRRRFGQNGKRDTNDDRLLLVVLSSYLHLQPTK